VDRAAFARKLVRQFDATTSGGCGASGGGGDRCERADPEQWCDDGKRVDAAVFASAVEREQDGSWLAPADGAVLSEGDWLRTSEDGYTLLTFADGSTAALDPATELVIEQASVDGARTITLNRLAGRIWNDVAPGATPASYLVRTADAAIEAHETTFGTLVTDTTVTATATPSTSQDSATR
jgi:hypothetical protein